MCSDAPQPDPAIAQAGLENIKLGKEAFAFYKDVYENDLKPMQQQNAALSQDLIRKAIASQDQQQEFAKEQNDYYKSTYRPVEQQSVDDAMGYDSVENQERRAALAGNNVTQSYSLARGENLRALGRYGINPNSGAFASTNARLTNEEALARAGASTGAAFDTQDKAIALRAGVANFGRNMPNTAAAYYGNAGAAGGQAMGLSTQAMNNVQGNAAFMQNGYGTAMQGNTSGAGILTNLYGAQSQAAASQNAGMGQVAGLVAKAGAAYMTGGASLAMGMADGGQVHGPGTGTSDSVRAVNTDTGGAIRLSNHEYVIPADVVRAKGVEFFDKLKAKYHTPVAHQRRAALA